MIVLYQCTRKRFPVDICTKAAGEFKLLGV